MPCIPYPLRLAVATLRHVGAYVFAMAHVRRARMPTAEHSARQTKADPFACQYCTGIEGIHP